MVSGFTCKLVDLQQEIHHRIVYYRQWQCNDYYGPIKLCELGPNKNCKHLSCAPVGSKSPPADVTSCGNNKWCSEDKCVDMSRSPGAVNGEWGEWSSWFDRSQSCGGDESYTERHCDNPRPANNGRCCVGKGWRYRLCNKELCDEDALSELCDEDALSFREVQ
jgi:hypothetical protein